MERAGHEVLRLLRDRHAGNRGGDIIHPLVTTMRILITGNKGFIGSHLERRLANNGHEVWGIDSVEAQVHFEDQERKPRIGKYDPNLLRRMLGTDRRGTEVVYHLAARVGVGQSMYEVADYVSANSLDTAILLEALCDSSVKRLIVASSMSIYGEGALSSHLRC